MAFDRRGYYYHSRRDGQRVGRVYLGNGPVAQLAALLAEQRRTEAAARSAARARAWSASEAARATAEAGLAALDELADLLMRATLAAAGYHRHERGAWRRRRMNGDEATGGRGAGRPGVEGDGTGSARGKTEPEEGGSPPAGPDDQPLTRDELRELLDRAERGDLDVLPALSAVLDRTPRLWRYAGDLARDAIADWVDLVAAGNLLTRESVNRKVAELKGELAGPDAPPLERLLAERVVCCWMQASHADAAVAGLPGRGQGATVAQLDLMQRRQERTQRSFVAAIKALATVRRLGVAVPPATPKAAVGADGASPRRGRSGRTRSGPAGAPAAGHHDASRRDSDAGMVPGRGGIVPKAIRDRLQGMAAADN